MKTHSSNTFRKKTDSQTTMAQSVQHATEARRVPCSGLGHSIFGQNLIT